MIIFAIKFWTSDISIIKTYNKYVYKNCKRKIQVYSTYTKIRNPLLDIRINVSKFYHVDFNHNDYTIVLDNYNTVSEGLKSINFWYNNYKLLIILKLNLM